MHEIILFVIYVQFYLLDISYVHKSISQIKSSREFFSHHALSYTNRYLAYFVLILYYVELIGLVYVTFLLVLSPTNIICFNLDIYDLHALLFNEVKCDEINK